jgi:hypothetical protein
MTALMSRLNSLIRKGSPSLVFVSGLRIPNSWAFGFRFPSVVACWGGGRHVRLCAAVLACCQSGSGAARQARAGRGREARARGWGYRAGGGGGRGNGTPPLRGRMFRIFFHSETRLGRRLGIQLVVRPSQIFPKKHSSSQSVIHRACRPIDWIGRRWSSVA